MPGGKKRRGCGVDEAGQFLNARHAPASPYTLGQIPAMKPRPGAAALHRTALALSRELLHRRPPIACASASSASGSRRSANSSSAASRAPGSASSKKAGRLQVSGAAATLATGCVCFSFGKTRAGSVRRRRIAPAVPMDSRGRLQKNALAAAARCPARAAGRRTPRRSDRLASMAATAREGALAGPAPRAPARAGPEGWPDD